MTPQNFVDSLEIHLNNGSIQTHEVFIYLRNFLFFEGQRAEIVKQYPHSWVAALDDTLYNSPSLKELETKLNSLPGGGDYAYIEEIP